MSESNETRSTSADQATNTQGSSGSPYGAHSGGSYRVPGYGYGVYGAGYGSPRPGHSLLQEWLSPAKIIRVLLRKWFLIVLFTALGGAGAYVHYSKQPRVYRTATLVEMTVRAPRIMGTSVMHDSGGGRSEDVVNTRLTRMKGRHFRSIYTKHFEELWANHPDANGEAPSVARMSFHRVSRSHMVNFTASHEVPLAAMLSANAAAETARGFFLKENRQQSDNAVEWLKKQADLQAEKVNEAEKEFVTFRAKNQIQVLEAEQEAARQKLLSLNDKVVELEKEILLSRELLLTAERGIREPKLRRVIAKSLPNNAVFESVYSEIVQLESEKEKLLQKYTDQHPSVSDINLKLSQLRNKSLGEFQNNYSAFENELVLKNRQLDVLKGEITELREKLTELEVTLVSRTSRLNGLSREKEARQISFQGILKRIEEARLASDEDATIIKIMETAGLPVRPVSPVLTSILTTGILLGLGLGLGVGFLSEFFEDRVLNTQEVEYALGLPVLGVIPKAKSSEREDLGAACLNDQFGVMVETFASLRAYAETQRKEDSCQVLVVTSSAPKEGKTICSSNLAISSARVGQKTLLVDFDMRRPRVASIYKDALDRIENPEQANLLHHLAEHGAAGLDEIVLRGPVDNLDVLASIPSKVYNPSDVIGSLILPEFIEWARERYDRVILDTPPVGLISDAVVLGGAFADGVFLVCRANSTRSRALKHVSQLLQEQNAPIFGVIMNDVKVGRMRGLGNSHYRYFAYSYQQHYSDDRS